MKIALTGAHCVGKTTLAEKLQESLAHYICRQEPYVELADRGYLFAETPVLDDFLVQLEHAIKAVSTDEQNVLFDRCPLDFLAYIEATGGADAALRVYHRVETAMEAIDLLVLVPIEQPDVIGCPATEFPELRETVQELLREWIADVDVPTLEVRGTLQERAAAVLQYLGANAER